MKVDPLSYYVANSTLLYLFTHYFSEGADNKPLFANPAAVQRAAAILGATPEEISEIIFAPPIINQFTIRMRRSSQSKSPASLSPLSSTENTPEKQAKAIALQYIEALEGFAMGLYQEAVASLVRFINRYSCKYWSMVESLARGEGGDTVVS